MFRVIGDFFAPVSSTSILFIYLSQMSVLKCQRVWQLLDIVLSKTHSFKYRTHLRWIWKFEWQKRLEKWILFLMASGENIHLFQWLMVFVFVFGRFGGMPMNLPIKFTKIGTNPTDKLTTDGWNQNSALICVGVSAIAIVHVYCNYTGLAE